MLQFIFSPQETFLVLCQRWSCKNCSYCIDKILLYWNVAKEYGFSWQTTLLKWYKVGQSFTLLTLVAGLLFYGEYFKRNSQRWLEDPLSETLWPKRKHKYKKNNVWVVFIVKLPHLDMNIPGVVFVHISKFFQQCFLSFTKRNINSA